MSAVARLRANGAESITSSTPADGKARGKIIKAANQFKLCSGDTCQNGKHLKTPRPKTVLTGGSAKGSAESRMLLPPHLHQTQGSCVAASRGFVECRYLMQCHDDAHQSNGPIHSAPAFSGYLPSQRRLSPLSFAWQGDRTRLAERHDAQSRREKANSKKLRCA